ncbi:MAG: cupin domain-containing protein [Cyanobacteria bacterium J06635_15]
MIYPEQPQIPDDVSADEESLAALYALGSLGGNDSQTDSHDVQAEKMSAATFAQQVSDYEATLAAIPYSVPLMPLASDLKSRLFQRIANESDSLELGPHSAKLLELLKCSIEDLKRQSVALTWSPMVGANAEMAVLQTDDLHREVAFFVRATVGGAFPNHTHASGETVFVLDGDFAVDGRVYNPGDRVSSLGRTTHQPKTRQGCLLFCISSIDDEILG